MGRMASPHVNAADGFEAAVSCADRMATLSDRSEGVVKELVGGNELLDLDEVSITRTAIPHAGGVGFPASRLPRASARRRSVVQAPL